jgi:hypothetical protein
MKIQVSNWDRGDKELESSMLEMLDEGDLQKSPLLTHHDKELLKNSMRRLTEANDSESGMISTDGA